MTIATEAPKLVAGSAGVDLLAWAVTGSALCLLTAVLCVLGYVVSAAVVGRAAGGGTLVRPGG